MWTGADVFCQRLIRTSQILGLTRVKLHPRSMIKFSGPSEQALHKSRWNRRYKVRWFDWQIWQANYYTRALWLLYSYISEAEITVLINFVIRHLPQCLLNTLVGWRLKDIQYLCGKEVIFSPSHCAHSNLSCLKRAKFSIQSLVLKDFIHFPAYHFVEVLGGVSKSFEFMAY